MSRKPQAHSYLRFSDPKQSRGSSKKRQQAVIDAAERYLAERGIKLVENYADYGKSASRKVRHNTSHNPLELETDQRDLQRFLDEVQAGRVRAGDLLIVESFDRITRGEERKAAALLLTLINRGIEIVKFNPTETGWQVEVFNEANCDLTKLIVMIVELSRANNETIWKKKRVRDAWAERIKEGRPYPGRVPVWIVRRNGKLIHDPDSDNCQIVLNMVKWFLHGDGQETIAKRLIREGARMDLHSRDLETNQHNYLTNFYPRYIGAILRNRALIGEYHPHCGHSWESTERQPAIADYFPALIDRDTFNAIQAELKKRDKTRIRGRQTQTNIFRNLIRTPAGLPYHMQNRKHHGCRKLHLPRTAANVSLDLDFFETGFLRFVSELSPDMIQQDSGEDKAAELRAEIAEDSEQIAKIERNGGTKYASIAKILLRLEQQREAKLAELAELESATQAPTIGQLQSVCAALASADDPEPIRQRIHHALRGLVSSITLTIETINYDRGFLAVVKFHDGSWRVLAGVRCWLGKRGKRDQYTTFASSDFTPAERKVIGSVYRLPDSRHLMALIERWRVDCRHDVARSCVSGAA